ncbi:hypothetical protein MUB24_12835 [Lederbergia sp. NSJ-179]|uniref:hypothetical protein n=1 Tax=Lederbergia sp. NSJ-179 TaxID=2931402 RepID=UPI001FD34F48|nr:hypothetical protein [Lederbergia sp. NSJ-179]MCJ7841768.1 hypothetical protein [Lederbergia sp. NSJ-179]
MKKDLLEKYPSWVHELKSINRNLTLTNDLDSLISCSLLSHLFGLKINYFYSFNKISQLNQSDQRQSIGVDCALKQGLCFDNHVTMLDFTSYINPLSANINAIESVNRNRYTDKFAMSTLIQLWSLYNLPLPSTLEGKMILLCIDVGFKAYYDEEFRPIFLSYLEQLEMMELAEVLESHIRDQMYDFMLNHELDSGIIMRNSGELSIYTTGNNPNSFLYGLDLKWIGKHLGFNIELPQGVFDVIERFETRTIDWHELNQKTIDRAFSYAFINKNKIMISLKENRHEGN